MGLCASEELIPPEEIEKKSSKSIEQTPPIDYIIKIILLGASGAGKSTLFRQFRIIYGSCLEEYERINFTHNIHSNVIVPMQDLCALYHIYGGGLTINNASKYIIDNSGEDANLTSEIIKHIRTLWATPGIQETYEKSAYWRDIQIFEYFFNRIDEISKEGYIPTDIDLLQHYTSTTGIVEDTFNTSNSGVALKVFDVGGTRSERKKWIHCFENVTGVIMLASLCGYNQVLYEDESQSKMTEAISLFEYLCKSEWFEDSMMILFLTKQDLFKTKLKMFPLKYYYAEFTGNTHDEAMHFIAQKFESVSCDKHSIKIHFISTTDTKNVQEIMKKVNDDLFKKKLCMDGLI